MLTMLDARGVADLEAFLPSPDVAKHPVGAVRDILAEVRHGGDEAVRRLTRRFDGVAVAVARVPKEDLRAALESLDRDLRGALEVAADRVRRCHERRRPLGRADEDDGILVEERFVPLERAGLYVPGGTAAYPSSVLMVAIPAQAAGVADLVMCTPPSADGSVSPVVLAAAALVGIEEVHAIGGAQAIAAMAYGTESVRRVDAIAGPGNLFVTLAKREVSDVVRIPAAFAGPSEVVVIADDTVDPELAAIDIVVQAEHGPDGLAWLVTWSETVAAEVSERVRALAESSPRRAAIEATLRENGYVVLVEDAQRAIAVANVVAPEHLELLVADPDALSREVRHAGAVFCGPWSPASLGDYAAGPSHVLPVSRTARFGGALGVEDFGKRMNVIRASEAGLRGLAPTVARLARAEGLQAHEASVTSRVG
jgi:histidinol dehydrogenase